MEGISRLQNATWPGKRTGRSRGRKERTDERVKHSCADRYDGSNCLHNIMEMAVERWYTYRQRIANSYAVNKPIMI